TLSIVGKYPDLFRVRALAAGRNIGLLRKQIKAFRPRYASVISERDAVVLQREFRGVEFFFGQEGLNALSRLEGIDLMVMAILGLAALMPTYIGLRAGRRVALASKEVMVAGGRVIREIRRSGELLVPVDSEHSAVYQLIRGETHNRVRRVILTASGGPFLDLPARDLRRVTPRQALRHPRWKMGRKITIDSATMMNKGLEMIEARWLFDLRPEQIDVIIHPQSIIHSMVEFADGAVLAQMGVPDMRLPVAYAMNAGKRLDLGMRGLDFGKVGALNFIKPDMGKFRCLGIAMEVMRRDDSSSIVMNAANDAAVEAFLKGTIGFTDIAKVVEYAVDRHYYKPVNSVDDIIAMDREVKKYVRERIDKPC
ncbi:MAG: 1-deoxy-D-xylulose-5-phosphate reductoisomerase, partial [Deltaproteobacteria bacterium]|nr:1-deoxy-D-xylulose-5-phosphate reductoisomerase [Deltaproteobacteria bacterium]